MIENDENREERLHCIKTKTLLTHSGVQLAHTIYDKACAIVAVSSAAVFSLCVRSWNIFVGALCETIFFTFLRLLLLETLSRFLSLKKRSSQLCANAVSFFSRENPIKNVQ